MRVQRNHIAESLKENPSPRRKSPELIATAYGNARLKSADGTGPELMHSPNPIHEPESRASASDTPFVTTDINDRVKGVHSTTF